MAITTARPVSRAFFIFVIFGIFDQKMSIFGSFWTEFALFYPFLKN